MLILHNDSARLVQDNEMIIIVRSSSDHHCENLLIQI